MVSPARPPEADLTRKKPVACHRHGITLRGFCHEDGTSRLPVMGPPGVSCRWFWSLSCSDACKSSDLEVRADGVPGGQRD